METNWSSPPSVAIDFIHEHGKAKGTLLPGTGEVMHLHAAEVEYEWRNKGLGDKYHKERLEDLKEEHTIKYATCVVNSDNQPQVKILESNGWELLKEFQGYYSKLRLYGRAIV